MHKLLDEVQLERQLGILLAHFQVVGVLLPLCIVLEHLALLLLELGRMLVLDGVQLLLVPLEHLRHRLQVVVRLDIVVVDGLEVRLVLLQLLVRHNLCVFPFKQTPRLVNVT